MIDLARRFGIGISKLVEMDRQIHKLKSIKNAETRLQATEELLRNYPKHPKLHLSLALCMNKLGDTRQFEQLDRYAEVMREWQTETGLAELDMEFIGIGMVAGSLGNHYAVEGLLRANQYGLRPAKKPFLLLPENVQLSNPSLFEYFEPYLQVIRNEEAIMALRKLESILMLPLGFCLQMNDGCLLMDIAANQIEQERQKQGLEPALFQLSDRHREMGELALKKFGLPDDTWYVTLHVRESGYRGEPKEFAGANWRNANPLDYIKACKAVTEAGGWIFRMGDPSMTPLPHIPQVIDFAFHESCSDWMDVFLHATCRFMIGTSSGPIRIPRYFGKPVLFTNNTNIYHYFNLMEHDLYLRRLLKQNGDNKHLSFKEIMTPPVGAFGSMKSFRDAGLHIVKNTPEEIEAATKEMIERTTLGHTIPDDDLQKHFKAIAESCGLDYGGQPVKAFAPISRAFLEQYSDLLRD